MKLMNLGTLAIAGAALAATLYSAPANASAASDAATRQAAQSLAIQNGLPADYYDRQQAIQKGEMPASSAYSAYNMPYGVPATAYPGFAYGTDPYQVNSYSNYSNPGYAYSNPGYGYATPNSAAYNYGYANPNYGYANPNYGYSDPNYGYANPNYGYGTSIAPTTNSSGFLGGLLRRFY